MIQFSRLIDFVNEIIMSKIERIKAEISFHEKMFFAALAVIMALVGWAAEHYLTISFWILLLCASGFFAVWLLRFGATNR